MTRPLASSVSRVSCLLVLLAFASAAWAKVEFVPHDGTFLDVTIDGKHFTTYHFDAKADPKFSKPYFHPVLAPDGTPLTSDQVKSGGDHPHHRSFYVAHGDVNGVDHWAYAKTDDPAKQPRQRHLGFDKVDGDTLVERLAWDAADAKTPLLNETRTMRFFALEDGTRAVDLTVALTPAGDQPVTLGDTKEAGLCSVRLVKSISDKSAITTSTGKTGEKETWGKPAAWCDTSGQINDKPYGVAILDHPTNPRHPTRWHVRSYGLMSANPFGLSDFDKAPKGTGNLTINPGSTTTFRYRVLFHTGDAGAAKVAEKFEAFAKE